MSIAEAPVRQLTIQEWYEQYRDYQGRCELVHGHAIMTPTDVGKNLDTTMRIALLLQHLRRDSWRPLIGASLQTQSAPGPSARVPDLAVVCAQSVGGGWLFKARDVALVVEVISPSSVETDWVTKREEYAAAGIPNYLIVDARFDDGPRLWLFELARADQPGAPGVAGPPDEPSTYPSYPDPTGDGSSVTLHIPGCDPITITAADLT